jgi:hypothetical protein
MFGITGGELLVVVFVVVAVVSAPWWPRLGAAIALRLSGVSPEAEARSSAPSGEPRDGPPDQ